MKKTIFLIGVMCLIPVSSWALPISVYFEPQDSIVQVGDILTVDLKADIPEPVLGWGLDVTFDSSIISQIPPPAIGSSWNVPPSNPDGDGLAGLAFPLPVAGNDILLATLTFDVIALGSSGLFASATPGDLTEGFPLAAGGFAQVVFQPGSVSAVPEPATILLVGSGLIGLARLRKKFKKI